jgi:lycopene beta-cyclase
VQAYGGDFLMEQPVQQLRGFFGAFFALDESTWSGFLAGWPGLPGNFNHETWDRRLKFALNMFTKMENPVRAAMVLYAIKYTLHFGTGTLLRSLTPGFLFGSGPADYMWEEMPTKLGDDAAKVEAKSMMKEFVPTAGENAVEVKSVEVREDALVYPAPFNS